MAATTYLAAPSIIRQAANQRGVAVVAGIKLLARTAALCAAARKARSSALKKLENGSASATPPGENREKPASENEEMLREPPAQQSAKMEEGGIGAQHRLLSA